ncbi:hypothetical protein DVP38_12230 [Yersinia enterocolitica]|nr:hypothetical protein [Yersinia enterocolitica]EKN6227804.1 hypothetical protein [Yersinia enterocolitica]EKN6274357.1 hypothetical protein [Yersinia enterocolitica]EKN6283394.1 hypothetical protein [Yersinia enterocolitica]
MALASSTGKLAYLFAGGDILWLPPVLQFGNCLLGGNLTSGNHAFRWIPVWIPRPWIPILVCCHASGNSH